MPLFTHAGIDTRYFAAPVEWFLTEHDLAEKSALYVREATRLSAAAAGLALEKAGLAPADIDYVIYVNTTGLATPSIDARLINVLGWTVLQEGLQVVFAQRIPEIVEQTAAEDVGVFLGAHGLKIADLDAFLLHPGGTKVLEAYQNALALEPQQLDLPRQVLRNHGNMSSATVFFVLERYLEENPPGKGGHGLISALGPGFCSESLLVGL